MIEKYRFTELKPSKDFKKLVRVTDGEEVNLLGFYTPVIVPNKSFDPLDRHAIHNFLALFAPKDANAYLEGRVKTISIEGDEEDLFARMKFSAVSFYKISQKQGQIERRDLSTMMY